MTRRRFACSKYLACGTALLGMLNTISVRADELTNISGAFMGWQNESSALLTRKIKPEIKAEDLGIKARVAGANYNVAKKEGERASQLISDIVRTQETHPAYPEALLLLGEV